MSHELRSLIIPQREAEELVFLEMLAHPGTRRPAQLGVILNNLQAVLSLSSSQMILHTWSLVFVICIYNESRNLN